MSIPNTGPQYPMPPFVGGPEGGIHPEPPAGHMDYEPDPFGPGYGVGDGSDPGFDFHPEPPMPPERPGPPHPEPPMPPIPPGQPPLVPPGPGMVPPMPGEGPDDGPVMPGGRGMPQIPSLPPTHSMPGYEDRTAPLPNLGGLQGGTRDIMNKLKGPLLGR